MLLLRLIIILFYTLTLCQNTFAVEGPSSVTDQFVQSQLKQLPTGELESLWGRLQKDYQSYFEDDSFPNLFSPASEKEGWGIKSIIWAFCKYFFREVLYSTDLLGSIIVLTVFSVLLQTLQSTFESNQVSRVAYAIIFMVILVLAMQSFTAAVGAAKYAIGGMIDLMLALVPLLLTLLTTMGNLGSAALFHPLVIFMIHAISMVIYTVVFPLLFFSTILHIVSNISEKYKLNQLAGLLSKISVVLLGGMLTIFLSVISIQGMTASVTDGVTIRTAKYVTGNFVPVIGRTLSDATDTVAGASLLLKNTVGLAGVIILLIMCAFPALKILALTFIYKASAALLQPLGQNPIINTLSTIGNTMIYIFVSLAVVGLMFFLAVTVIIASGNISLMMR